MSPKKTSRTRRGPSGAGGAGDGGGATVSSPAGATTGLRFTSVVPRTDRSPRRTCRISRVRRQLRATAASYGTARDGAEFHSNR
ncbi:hypothetical protein EASAB2608_05977 [Streptomyces sp. EAS-AB2608]|uniref:Uncharacterized protein n=1 Tax=Streptomyces bangladeshensis TaxID=295352 RepID=A0ABP5NFD3_9ACTN|nr:hypothetical protein EASAB2608_05977 [Streptomyces sp. EAS-AB2608]